ncbi:MULTISPECIES: DUF5105 domain-containing protein [Listeria]|uniref:DUF5105 domain-containing protein n=1 Tax=Listeria TaxID=1637 RepID=UPI000B58A725|nr:MULTISPECIES: DUF5105 domain-containing protein [Listeria]
MSIFLTACGNDRVEPKEAAEITVNALVYGKDTDKVKDVYGEDGTDTEKEFEEGFKESFTSTLARMTGSALDIDKEVDDLYSALRNRVKEKATYTTKVTNDDKENPEITFSVKGLDMKAVQQGLTTELQKEVIADPSLATDKDKLVKKMLEVYTEQIKKADVVSTPVDVKLKLEVNSKDESEWKISNQIAFVQSLMKAFYMGGM